MFIYEYHKHLFGRKISELAQQRNRPLLNQRPVNFMLKQSRKSTFDEFQKQLALLGFLFVLFRSEWQNLNLLNIFQSARKNFFDLFFENFGERMLTHFLFLFYFYDEYTQDGDCVQHVKWILLIDPVPARIFRDTKIENLTTQFTFFLPM